MTAVKFVLSSALGRMMLKQTRLAEARQNRMHEELYGIDWKVDGGVPEGHQFYAKPVGIKFKNGNYLKIE